MNRIIDDRVAAELVTASLLTIVPDADVGSLGEHTDLRDSLELDSLDFLSFVEQLGRRSGRRIDEDDYDRLRTMHSCVEYLCEHGMSRPQP